MRPTILIIGAGKSATLLIAYLQEKAVEHNWYILLADADENLAIQKWNQHPNGQALGIDIENNAARASLIQSATLVISMLPPVLHLLIAKDCIQFGKDLFTASYVDMEMRSLEKEILDKQLFFLCEMGLDPGIDHMSAMEIIHRLRQKGAKINSFKSHCGGLVAPESDTNPWHYKISWNPKNILLAGKSGALYRENGQTIEKAYEAIFENTPLVNIPLLGNLAYYPNRNSLSYINLYQLSEVQNFIRTTLRHPDFCKGWHAVIQLQLTQETPIQIAQGTSVKNWFLEHLKKSALAEKYQQLLADKDIRPLLDYLGLEDHTLIPQLLHSNASILQWIIEQKWQLFPSDKDVVAMLHQFEYELNGRQYQLESSMVVFGQNAVHTAMAKTVGLPLAISVCAYLNGEIPLKGLHIPTHALIYTPVLKRLKAAGIFFNEKETYI